MCGVFALFGAQVSEEVARASFQKCQRRGPEYSSFQTMKSTTTKFCTKKWAPPQRHIPIAK